MVSLSGIFRSVVIFIKALCVEKVEKLNSSEIMSSSHKQFSHGSCIVREKASVKPKKRHGSPLGVVNYENTVELDVHPNKLKTCMSGINLLQFWIAFYAVYVQFQKNYRSGLYRPQLSACLIISTAL